MLKKIFSSALLILSLSLFVSCQENGKKDTDKRTYKSSRKSRDAQKGEESSMPVRKRTTNDRPCPPPTKCPKGCKKKCCVNKEKIENAITSNDKSVQETQEVISTKELTSKDLPLEELKAAIERQNALELSDLEKEQVE